MDKNSTATKLEEFLCNWNGNMPEYPLTVPVLKKPHAVMGAIFQVFDRLGIDRDAILSPPPEESRNEHLKYYWDLLPVINMTRVINHLFALMPRMGLTISIIDFLQPTSTRSHTILLLLFNLMLFKENRLRDIQPQEEILFARTDEVKRLEDRKNKLLELLNDQAVEKEHRGERIKKLDNEIKQFEEELKVEKEAFEEEQKEFQAIMQDNKQLAKAVEQKRVQKDGLIAEIKKKQAMKVYDADDIRAQAEQAAQNVQDAEARLKALEETLRQKENSLKNLQTVKPNLDTANNLLHEIMKLSESLREHESGDLEADSKNGELEVLNTEVSEQSAQLAELKTARADAAAIRQQAHAKRQHDRAKALSDLREAAENTKKCKELYQKVLQRIQEIKNLTLKYEEQKEVRYKELAEIESNFTNEIKHMDETLLKKALEAKKQIEDRLKKREESSG